MDDVNALIDSSLSSGQRVVLVIDSDPDNLYLIELVFNYLGFRVISAASEAEAIELAKEASLNLLAISLPPLIQDCELVVSRLRSSVNFDAIPVLAVTTIAHPDCGDQLIAIGCNDFICKPFMLDDLARIVHRMIRSKLSQYSA